MSYQNGDRSKHGEVVRGYVACNLADRTPTKVERQYRKRSAIETCYRLFRQARATTTTQDPLVRFTFVIVGFLLENLWVVLRWAVVARSRRGGRDLPEQFTFTTFCDWIRYELEAELERRWEIETNGVGVPDAYAPASDQPSPSYSTRQQQEQKPIVSPLSTVLHRSTENYPATAVRFFDSVVFNMAAELSVGKYRT